MIYATVIRSIQFTHGSLTTDKRSIVTHAVTMVITDDCGNMRCAGAVCWQIVFLAYRVTRDEGWNRT